MLKEFLLSRIESEDAKEVYESLRTLTRKVSTFEAFQKKMKKFVER